MTDPITAVQLTDSIFSLIRVCRSIILTIQAYRSGDDDLGSLCSDVENHTEFLVGLRRVLNHRRTNLSMSPTVIKNALEEAEKTILLLQKRVKAIVETESLVTRRLKWLREKGDFEKLLMRIRNHNVALQSFLILMQVYVALMHLYLYNH